MRADAILRSKNLKVTQQRELILNIILDSENRLTASDIHKKITEMGKDYGLATVYRTLASLEESGVLKKSEMPGDDCGFYSLGTGHKHCFVCTDCKKEFEIDICPLNSGSNDIAKQMDFTVTGHSFEIFGVCKNCKYNKNR